MGDGPLSPHARSSRVLIVEDEPADLALWRYAFRDSGVTAHICFANDGEEALAKIRDARVGFDLVLLDLNLPRMGGKELLQKIRTDPRFAELPIIVASTACTKADVDECYELGANQYFDKPTSYPELVVMARQLTECLTKK